MAEPLLAGLKVIDAASFIAAPVAATMLADFGADVIKIEPPTGDSYRGLSTFPGFPSSDVDYAYMMDNRSKRGFALDLRQEAGRAVLRELVAGADVFITNYPPLVRERLGLSYEDIAPLNERLIYASLSAYGETGPEVHRTGFDSTAFWARTGLMDLVKPDPDGAPARSLPGMGDHPTGVTLFAAIMTALYRRQITGKGGKAYTNLMANGVWCNAFYTQAALCGLDIPTRPKRENWATGLANHYRCADGRWFILSLVNEEKQWPNLLRAINRSDLATDSRFAEKPARHRHARDLIAVLDEVFLRQAWPFWQQRLEEEGLAFGVIGRTEDISGDPQMQAADIIIPHDDPSGLSTHTVGSPVWLEGSEKTAPCPAPRIGQHTDEILAELGRTPEDIKALRASGVVA